MTRLLSIALVSSCLVIGVTSAALADASCKVQATDKKLAGAAMTSFTKKCAKDAASACEAQAATKKLAGAAKTSFVKKCTSDAVGG
ncbi:hypothetical protein GCM10007874_69790 [Labrys miyagiensis]|uniref:PsiF repeat-containing protein n=1 Tax=Labrys miyagiensis TaxID=346912 RepID=A0ABQ6CUC0_9HYPH|nr:hypothetical protein [Labrys miyagiensis]GLS23958.1 hypothetical protein GCM10007874_69790 [Labrys miyagiensis]